MRIFLLAIVSAALLFGASKAEVELKAKLAAANAQLAAKAKETAALQDALKTAATAQAQLAEALREKKAMQASLDALAVRDRAAEQDALKVVSQAASQAAQASQAAGQATKAATKNKQDLVKAITAATKDNKQQADTVTRVAGEAVAASDANTAEVKQAVTESNEQQENRANELVLKIEEVKQQGHHDNLLLYFAALGSVLGFGTTAFKFVTDYRAAAVTRDHRALELSKIAEVKNAADASYREANTVNQKIEHIGLKMKDGEPLKPEAKEAEKA